jgi:hypothetical protein
MNVLTKNNGVLYTIIVVAPNKMFNAFVPEMGPSVFFLNVIENRPIHVRFCINLPTQMVGVGASNVHPPYNKDLMFH